LQSLRSLQMRSFSLVSLLGVTPGYFEAVFTLFYASHFLYSLCGRCSRRRSQWQREVESGPRAEFTFGPDVATMYLDDVLNNGKPKSRAA